MGNFRLTDKAVASGRKCALLILLLGHGVVLKLELADTLGEKIGRIFSVQCVKQKKPVVSLFEKVSIGFAGGWVAARHRLFS